MSSAAPLFVYIGTSNAGPGTGFSLARFDPDTGTLTRPELILEARDPAIFVIHPDGKHLYACNSGAPGGVSAYGIDRGSGALTLLNFKPSAGRGPSHLSLDHTGRYVLDANYGGGHVEVLAIAADGSLEEQTAFVQHQGRSVHPERQTKPYAHCIKVDPTNRFALAADLGTDHVVVYRFDAAKGTLTPNDPPFASVTPGSGPRHIAWHPNGRWVYVIEEMANAVTAFSWDATRGTLTEFQTVPTLPADFTGTNTAAEIMVHTDGRFLYASNRGHDSIAVFALDDAGRLTPRQHISSQGKTPRYFVLDPTNRWLIATNQDSANAAIFRIDEKSGELTLHGVQTTLARPCGLAFLSSP
jgi:6-phosphogluconolactonase